MKIRQQYHFRQSDKGLLVWDVLKLIELSSGFAIKDVLLSGIQELDKPYWNGNGKALSSREIADHAKLIMEADISHPIILCSEGRVMDGMHRVCKAYIMGESTIKTVQFPNYIEPHHVGKQPSELPY